MAMLQPIPATVSIEQLCAWLNVPKRSADLTISGFSTDTRTIAPGNCFIALKGENFNGNLYAAQAAAQGAVLCILSEEPQTSLSVPYLVVEDCVKAYGKIAAGYLRALKETGAKVIGITGSSGKTTVKDMTTHVLSKRFDAYCTAGNHNNHIGLPFTILRIPRSAQIIVLEMGMNHTGEISYLTQIARPHMGIITNIGTAHIGNLGSQEAIFAAKLELAEGMDPQTGVLVLPAEDPYLPTLLHREKPPCRLYYTSRSGAAFAKLTAEDITETAEDTRFTARLCDECAAVTLPMTGIHNVSNALLAMQTGILCGMTLAETAAALADFAPAALRSDRVTIGNCTVIRDYYNANPEAMRASLTALQTIAGDSVRVAVLGNMNELGAHAKDAHRALGALAKDCADHVFFCGVNHADFAEGCGEGCFAYDTQSALIDVLCDTVSALGDVPVTMLIKGSRGMKMENVFAALSSHLQNSQ